MDGRAFLDPARDLAAGPAEPHWRTAAGNAYYALLLECREALGRWGTPLPPHQNVHSFVRLTVLFAKDADLKRLGTTLDGLVQLRNRASYQLNPAPSFTSGAAAQRAVQDATDAIALLDAIE